MGKTKVVLDSNILISALGWSGKPREIFEKCLSGELELVTSSAQLEEVTKVMNYSKFTFTEEQKEAFLGILTTVSTLVEITGQLKVIKDDPDDNIILETAVICGADYIITGDMHLLSLNKFGKIRILSATDFLEF